MSDAPAELDILAALNATPSRGERKCKLAKFLDSIPAETPGREELIARVEDAAMFPAQSLTMTFTALGTPIHKDTIADHRNQCCRCFQ